MAVKVLIVAWLMIEKLPVLLDGAARVATEVNEWQLIMQAQMSPGGGSFVR